MKALKAPTPQAGSVRGKHDKDDRKHFFLFVSVFELWIYRMLDAVPSAGCVVCGAKRDDAQGFLVGAPFVLLGLKVLEAMCTEGAITGAGPTYRHFDVGRYRGLESDVRSDGENVWSCAECFTYTMATMGMLVVKTRGVSCHCASAWISAQLQGVSRRASKAGPSGKGGSPVDVFSSAQTPNRTGVA